MQQIEQQNNKKGSVLLLTLIITMIILTSSVVLGTLIISSLRRAQDETVSMSAFYATESTVEQALYAIRKDKTVPESIERDTCTPPFPANSFPGIDTAGCHVKIDYVTGLSNRLSQSVKKNQTLEYELIDSDGTTAGAGIDNLKIYCRTTSVWMEATIIPISYNSGTDQWKPKPDETKKYLFPCYFGTTSFYPISSLNPLYSYRVILKALYANASYVDLLAYNSSGVEVGVGGKFTVRAWADYSVFSRQEIKVEMKGISTVSSLFDSVLYSEQAIVKDILPGST